MELDDNLPQAVIDLFKEEVPGSVEVRTGPMDMTSCLQLYGVEDGFGPIEFTRILGMKCIEQTGYGVTGMCQHNDGEFIEVWLDPVDDVDVTVQLTTAQKAGKVLRRMNERATFEVNISDKPKEQYVDVFPDPVEQASEDWSMREETIDALRSEHIRVRSMSLGRERSRFNEESYRVWFRPIEY